LVVPLNKIDRTPLISVTMCSFELTLDRRGRYQVLWTTKATSVPLITEVKSVDAYRSVSGEDLTADDFLVAKDPEDPNTWLFPVGFKDKERRESHLRAAVNLINKWAFATEFDRNYALAKLTKLCKQYGIPLSAPIETGTLKNSTASTITVTSPPWQQYAYVSLDKTDLGNMPIKFEWNTQTEPEPLPDIRPRRKFSKED